MTTTHPLLSRVLAKYNLPDMGVGDLENSDDATLRVIGLLMLQLWRAEKNLRTRIGYDTDNFAKAIDRLDEGSEYLDHIRGDNFVTIIQYTAVRDALASLLDEAVAMYAYKNHLGAYAPEVAMEPERYQQT